MEEQKHQCAYGGPLDKSKGRGPCQFQENLEEDAFYKFARITFCPFHLPFATGKNGLGSYDVVGTTDITTRLKNTWEEDEIDSFNKLVLDALSLAFDHDQHCDLKGTVFPEAFKCENMTLPDVSFSDCYFPKGDASFDGSTFSGLADFSRTLFEEGKVEFEETTFAGLTQFTGTKFHGGNKSFKKARFSGVGVFFDDANFSGGIIDFSEIKCLSEVTSFTNTYFSCANTKFADARFENGGVSFSKSHFGGAVDFQRTRFEVPTVTFQSAVFAERSTVDFSSTIFSGQLADFTDAAFRESTVLFTSAEFGVDQIEVQTRTPKDSEAKSRSAFGIVKFDRAKFAGHANFANRPFYNSSLFADAVFDKAPEFHGSALHQDTTFPSIENFNDTKSDGAAHAYRTLRLAMKQQEAHEEEAWFWALEQRSKRNSLKCNPMKNWKNAFNWLPWMLSGFYALLSNYGLSINRPLAALTGWLLGATPISYFCLRGNVDKLFGSITYGDLLGFSLAQSLRPFFIWGDYEGAGIKSVLGADVDVLSVKLFATADSLISLVLIALLILAVRRRFRMQ